MGVTRRDKELPKLQGPRAPGLLIYPSSQERLLAHKKKLEKAHAETAAQWQAAADSVVLGGV
jgi:hypothetical protein